MFILFFSVSLQEDLDEKSPAIFQLGLLHKTGIDIVSVRERCTYVSFQHKSLQDFAASYFIHKRLLRSHNIQVIIRKIVTFRKKNWRTDYNLQMIVHASLSTTFKILYFHKTIWCNGWHAGLICGKSGVQLSEGKIFQFKNYFRPLPVVLKFQISLKRFCFDPTWSTCMQYNYLHQVKISYNKSAGLIAQPSAKFLKRILKGHMKVRLKPGLFWLIAIDITVHIITRTRLSYFFFILTQR